MRDMEKEPYSADEARVAAFFGELGIGGGDDPIGFMMASHVLMASQRNVLRKQVLEMGGIPRDHD